MPKIIGRTVTLDEKFIFNCPDGKVLRYSVSNGFYYYLCN